jgi:hypothetical protein
VTPDLIYRYQVKDRTLEDVLAADLKALNCMQQVNILCFKGFKLLDICNLHGSRATPVAYLAALFFFIAGYFNFEIKFICRAATKHGE